MAAQQLDRRLVGFAHEVEGARQQHGDGTGLRQSLDSRLVHMLQMIRRQSAVACRKLCTAQIGELFGVQFHAKAMRLRHLEDAADLLRRESNAFAEAVDGIGQTGPRYGWQHLVADFGDVGILVAVRFRRQRMRAEKGRRHRHWPQFADAAGGTQRFFLGGEIQPIARFDFESGHALAQESIDPRQRTADKILFARLTGGAHRRHDAAAGTRDLLVACAGQPQLEFMRAVAAIDDVRVAIDQARRDPAAFAIDGFRSLERRRPCGGPGIDDAALARGDQPALDEAEPFPFQGGKSGVLPEPVTLHGAIIMTIHNHMSRTGLWFHSLLLPEGWADNVRLTLADGRVEAITRNAPAESGDERHEIGLPGLPNLHSHAFQRGMAGFTEQRGPRLDSNEDSFWTWREAMYRFVDRMEPDDVEAIAAQAFLEMLEGGFTRVGEFHYVHHDTRGTPYSDIAELASRVAAAAAATGIALTLLPVFYAHAGFGGQPAAPGQRRFVNDVDQYGRLIEASRRAVSSLPDAIIGIAPHSLRAATPEEIAEILPLGAGGPVHIHIAEQTKEVEDCLAWSGKRPVELLFDRLPVDEHWCLVHATHVTDDEVDGMISRRAVAGLCPITEANLGDGIFPARRFLDKGGRFGVGSDSNVLIDAAEELRLLEYGQRLVLRSRNALASASAPSTGRRLFEGALAGGSQALGAASGIAVGAPADLVSLLAGDNALVHRRHDQWLDAWIFAGRHSLVDCVWRAGRKLVAGGRHVQREEIGRHYRQTLARMLRDA